MPAEVVSAARQFARERHAGQKRKHGLDYVFHPEEVAALLAFRYGVEDENVLCAAVLHDVIEECGVEPAELVERFGPEVADMVVALSRDKKRSYGEYAHRLAGQPVGVLLIKGADVLSNLRDSVLADWGTRRRVKRHARQYILPLVEQALGTDHLLARDLRLTLAAVKKR